ncbi:MAG: RagB/SusD family nutrient uptake outer membrane protein [Saprospiraceae bacterium]
MKKILFLFALLVTISACNDDILDIPPKDRIAEDAVWSDENLIKAYHNALYQNSIEHGFKIHMQSKATDEAYCSIAWDLGNVARRTMNPDNITSAATNHWTGGGNIYYWGTAFQAIRKINVFLEKMEGDAIAIQNKARLVAEAKFLRAFIYFNLIERFGGAPIVTEVYDLGEEVSFKRSSFDEVATFIETELLAAIPDLATKYASTDSNFGRATKDACNALLSRLMLYAASPLFNTTNDKTRWQKAATYAEQVMKSDYILEPNYSQVFNQPSGAPNNEMIFVRSFSATNSHQAPMHNLNRRYGAYGGWWASNGPTQNLVDDYDMTNGEPPFIYPGGVKTVNPASGYDPQNPYANRDPRFEATIIHDGSEYRGDIFEMWVSPDGSKWGFDSYKQSGDNPRSNYVLKKFMPESNIPLSWQQPYTNPWIIFRLGETYLNYAEAKFELGDEATCREYISKVRARVGMPAIPASVTGAELRRRLYNERRIELAFEEHRYWDVRRWKISDVAESGIIYGMDIVKDAAGKKNYVLNQLLDRGKFDPKFNLLPIETNEILRNPELEQTQGY